MRFRDTAQAVAVVARLPKRAFLLCAVHDDAIRLCNDELKVIAAELVTSVRRSVVIDWTVLESARAKIRVMVRRILKKHGYPPDLQDEATKLVLEQSEVLCADWAS